MLGYFTSRKQRTKIGLAFSSRYDISIGVPQGSILRALLFNIFINDLFFSITKSEVCNFADDNTLYSCNKNLENVFSNFKWDLKSVLEWFGKFQFMDIETGKVNFYNLFIDDVKVSCSKEVKLIRITIDNQLKFKKHIEELCKKAFYKPHTLRRLRPYLTVDKARLLANSFIDSQFNYAPLIWMFAGKTAINKICKIRYKTLLVVCNNFTDSYDELLSINNDISTHHKHLQYLAVEVYKTIVKINPEFMWTYFLKNSISYNLRKGDKVFLPPARSARYRISSVLFTGSLLWNKLPSSVKNGETLNEFKYRLKSGRKIY